MAQEKSLNDVRLTLDEIQAQPYFAHLSQEQKLALILLVFNLSLALYHSYSQEHEHS